MNLSTTYDAVEYLLGRRFMFMDGDHATQIPEITFVSGDQAGGNMKRATIRAHGEDGSRQTYKLAEIIEAVERGALVEAEGAPFVWDRGEMPKNYIKRGIAGPNKTTLRLVHGGRFE